MLRTYQLESDKFFSIDQRVKIPAEAKKYMRDLDSDMIASRELLSETQFCHPEPIEVDFVRSVSPISRRCSESEDADFCSIQEESIRKTDPKILIPEGKRWVIPINESGSLDLDQRSVDKYLEQV